LKRVRSHVMRLEGNTAMKINTAIRHCREGVRNIVRNGWMSFASASAISISLFILGIFLIMALNINYLTAQVENEVEIRVFMDVSAPETVISQVGDELGLIPEVKKINYISKEDGLKKFKETFGAENKEMLDSLDEENPLPDSYTVEVKNPLEIAKVAEQIWLLNKGRVPAPITKVDYGHDTVEVLFKVTSMIRNIGLVLVAGLAFTSIFLIANTIKLTIIARRREIGIMKLVGATNSFIRWPFFIEGALLGFIGSLIPVIALLYGYNELFDASENMLGILMVQLLPLEEIKWNLSFLLIGLGMLIGIWGSTLSIRKFLKV